MTQGRLNSFSPRGGNIDTHADYVQRFNETADEGALLWVDTQQRGRSKRDAETVTMGVDSGKSVTYLRPWPSNLVLRARTGVVGLWTWPMMAYALNATASRHSAPQPAKIGRTHAREESGHQ